MLTPWLPLPLSFAASAVLIAAIHSNRAWTADDAKSTGRRARMPNGGVALLGALCMGAVCVARLTPESPQPLYVLLSLAGGVWLLGLTQDVGRAPWWVRDAGLIACAAAAYHAGVAIESVKLPFSSQFHHFGGWPCALVTVVWTVLVTKSFLASRAIDGLPTGLGTVVATTFGLVALLQPQEDVARATGLAFSLAGACLGVHLLGRSSATAGVGSSGGALIGFVLGVVTILGALKNTAFLVVVLPLLAFGAPLINTTYAFTLRSPDKGGRRLAVARRREPLHEVLLRQEVDPRKIVAWFIAIELYLCAVAVLLVLLIEAHFVVKGGVMLLALPAGGVVFWSLAKFFSRVEPDAKPDAVRLFDVRITPVTMGEALDRIEGFIRSREPHHIVTSDSSAIVRAQSDQELHDILDTADMVTADGVGVIWGARLLDIPLFERVSGVDLVAKLAERGASADYRFFFLGAEPGVAAAAAERLAERFPGLQVVGTHHGYFTPEEEDALVERICDSEADILLVAMGIPRQEKWIRRHFDRLQVPVCIGVGGTFDVYSGKLKRAPEWVQRIGLEWLYRAVIEPSRFARLVAIPRFIAMTLGYRLRHGSP